MTIIQFIIYLRVSLTAQRPIAKLARVKKTQKQNKNQCNLYVINNNYNNSINRKSKSSLRNVKTNILIYSLLLGFWTLSIVQNSIN
jgi:hypothetical protein